jgi:hypothetical protein
LRLCVISIGQVLSDGVVPPRKRNLLFQE